MNLILIDEEMAEKIMSGLYWAYNEGQLEVDDAYNRLIENLRHTHPVVVASFPWLPGCKPNTLA